MKVYLSDDKRVLEILTAAQLPAHPLTSEAMPDLRHSEVIVLGAPGKARDSALALTARGVPDFRLKYVEVERYGSVLELIRAPKHLHWVDARPLSEAPDDPNFEVYDSGFPFLDPNLRWRASELAVIAGAYGSGKSTLAQLLATRFIAIHGRKLGWTALLCSWEDLASEMRRNVQVHASFHKADAAWLLASMHYVCRPPGEDRFIPWYMDLVRYYVRTFNTRFFVLDPWSEFDHVKPANQSETDYVRDMMKLFRRLVDELQIILLVVTHVPAKYVGGDGTVEAFRIAHAHGSSQFGNKADRGICVVRTKAFDPDRGHLIVRFDKAKIERRMGRKGTVALKYDETNHTITYDTAVTNEKAVREMWKG
jgi:archaellum biogenesis ATPase FlaH